MLVFHPSVIMSAVRLYGNVKVTRALKQCCELSINLRVTSLMSDFRCRKVKPDSLFPEKFPHSTVSLLFSDV